MFPSAATVLFISSLTFAAQNPNPARSMNSKITPVSRCGVVKICVRSSHLKAWSEVKSPQPFATHYCRFASTSGTS